MTDDETTAIRLLEEALHLRTHGERAPGGTENWPDWNRKTEAFLRKVLAAPHVEVIHQESWRAEIWDADEPSRPGWQVLCAGCGLIGRPPGWAYASPATANALASRHRRKHRALLD